jgi:addiction module RelE/StbE family toxin
MKKYEIIYRERAKKDLREIFEYIAYDNLDKAIDFTAYIKTTIENLSGYPYLGITIENSNLRKIIVPPYLIAYKIIETTQTIDITEIRHGARKPALQR